MTKKAGYIRKPRNTFSRKRNRILLVSAEGSNKTERNYFTSLSGLHLSVQFAGGNDTDPVRLAQHLIEAYQEYDLSEDDLAVCCIDTDFDPAKNTQIASAEKMIQKFSENTRLIISCPCFEIWFICHFVFTTRHYKDNSDVIAFLKKYLPEYTKSGRNFSEILSGKTRMAVKNAKALEEHCTKQGYHPHTTDFHPSTEAYQIIEWILNQSSSEQ